MMPPRSQQAARSDSTCPVSSPAYLVEHYPVWIDLGVTLRIQNHSLIGPEICEGDFCTFRAHIQRVNHCVIVKVILTDITNTVA